MTALHQEPIFEIGHRWPDEPRSQTANRKLDARSYRRHWHDEPKVYQLLDISTAGRDLLNEQAKAGVFSKIFDPSQSRTENFRRRSSIGKLRNTQCHSHDYPLHIAALERFQRNLGGGEVSHGLRTSQSVETASLLDFQFRASSAPVPYARTGAGRIPQCDPRPSFQTRTHGAHDASNAAAIQITNAMSPNVSMRRSSRIPAPVASIRADISSIASSALVDKPSIGSMS